MASCLCAVAATSGDYTYTVINGAATITAYSGSATTVTIPSQFSGIPVTGIGADAFKTRTALINLTIPSTVTSIVTATSFSTCASLINITVDPSNPSFSSEAGVLYNKDKTTLILYPAGKASDFVIPSSVTTIASNAFALAVNLRSVSIPSGVTTIDIRAFASCTSLTTVAIPNSVTSLGNQAFTYCSNLTAVTCSSNLSTLESFTFRDCVNLTSVSNLGGATSLEQSVFEGCSNLSSLTIPPTVTAIGAKAFWKCAKLVSIDVPDSVTTIGSSAFAYCTALSQVTIGQGVTILDSACFNACGNLTSITLGNSLTTIGGSAFMSCSKLTTLIIPNKVTTIGTAAFDGCYLLSRIYFMGNAPTLGTAVFSGSSPTTVYYLVGTTGWDTTFGGKPTSTVSTNTLNVTCDTSKGTITTTPQSALYITGTAVTIVVTPKAGYLFTSWTGDSTSTSTSISLTLNTNKTLTANFAEDTGDSDADGVSNFQEIVTYGSNPNLKDSSNDGIEDGKAVSLGYNPTTSFFALLQDIKSNPPAGLYNTTQYSDNYTAGQQNVLSNPNTHNLYTTSQIHSLTLGDLVLTRDVNGGFNLKYDIEQSSDLQSWLPYESFNLPLTNLPPDKAFIRIKAKQ